MNARFAALTFVGAMVVAGGVSYWVAHDQAGRGLSDVQRSDTQSVVKEVLAANPDLLKPPAPATPVAATPVPTQTAQLDLSDDQRQEVEGIIKNYLIANPEIIRDAIDAFQRKQDAAEQAAQIKAIGDNKDLLFASAREAVLGNPNGKITLVEFFDYNCAYCRRAQADMEQLLDTDKDVKVVLKEFPVLGDGSVQAAQVSVAVHMIAPDKYAEFHDTLFAEKGAVDGERALAVAEELGLDRAKIEEAMKSDEVKATINEAYDLANKLSLTGTPSYVTPAEVIVGAVGYDTLKEKLDAARAACATAAC